MKKILTFFAVVISILVLTSCSNENDGKTAYFTMSGSTSVEKLAKILAEVYSETHNASIDVQGGGSSAGVPNVVNGSSEIGLLSRNLKESEKEEDLNEYVVAIDGIAVAVNSVNEINNLTMEELNLIYSGKITNWSEINGEDLEIVLIGREAGSGTRDGFESVVGLKEVKADQEYNETGAVIAAISATPGAIGYISTAYLDKADKVITIDGEEATSKNIREKLYPLQRNYIMVTSGENEGVEAFIEYVLSSEGQEYVELAGCIKVK